MTSPVEDAIRWLADRGVGAESIRLVADSRLVRAGDVFVALPGTRVDGRKFIAAALAQGAAAVLCAADEHDAKVGAGETALDAAVLRVSGLQRRVGELAHRVYGRPSEHLWLVGVTGTNGKTSITQWIAQVLRQLGLRSTVIGTLGNGFVDALEPSPNTTPDAMTLHASLARYRQLGAVACAMEVSSIGLDQGRVDGAAFDVAVLTNLTRDHLDYHGSMAAYADAKRKLFAMPGLPTAVLNLDDPFAEVILDDFGGRTVGYSLNGGGAWAARVDELVLAENIVMKPAGVEFILRRRSTGQSATVVAPVLGRFNVANLLAVVGALLTRGESLEAVVAALGGLPPPPGRMECIAVQGQPLVVVDYAHTPDALDKALTVLRETADARGGRLICLMGCGGDRDPGKRPQMGAVAAARADRVVVTSDNPRSEAPHAIIAAIMQGIALPPAQVAIEPDRAVAIRQAIAAAQAEDVVLLAGKGHETYQEILGVRQAFSDLDHAKSALAGRSAAASHRTPHREGS
ncbi:MAG TPA: UDP-N-acetylmuramoyl-L-alanyl-D-glutamate--2,6-diaminopimelate ligase [Rhodocyclaceae bacterium]|nr:UDP-N-acetylmuramoyl-L-alanyl-D-glutamate--2,6-diaminopimelate ligase [Rhodocyclaceae bacterium]